jgi:cell division control protein 24
MYSKVVHTVSKILDMMEVEHIIKVPCIKRVSDPGVPKDIRAKIVNELVETERKFVQDMEALQVKYYLAKLSLPVYNSEANIVASTL